MIWLIVLIFCMLLLCMWLESDTRQEQIEMNRLIKEARQKQEVYRPTTRPWYGK